MEHRPIPLPSWDNLLAIPRADLEALIAQAIEAADSRDGDPDIEANGDEQDHDFAEDEEGHFGAHHGYVSLQLSAPGCPISDPDHSSWPEWHTMGRHKARTFNQSLPEEDIEEDDEDCGGDEGEPYFNDPMSRASASPGCIISDSDKGVDDEGEIDRGVPAFYGIDQTQMPTSYPANDRW